MSTSTSTSTSITSSSGPTTTTNNFSSSPTYAIYQDLWSFKFSTENFNQHKIRLVKVNEEKYIAFSKYFFNPFAQSYYPSKKHYFIPQRRWAELQTGLLELSNFLIRENNGQSAAAGGGRTEPGGFHESTISSRPTGEGALPIPTPPATPAIDLVNCNYSTAGAPIPTIISPHNKSGSVSGLPHHVTFLPFTSSAIEATKRGIDRP